LRATPREKKTRILKRLFSGETYGSVSIHEGCSKSTVKKFFDEFVDSARLSSIEEAAENYDVREEIEVLRDIACEAKKAGSSFPELLGGARLLLLLKKLGLSPTQLEDTINVLDKHREQFGDFVQSALKLARLEKETGKSHSELIVSYERTNGEIAKLSEKMKDAKSKFSKDKKAAEAKIRSLDNQIHTRESSLIELEERAETAQTVLDAFEKTQKELYNYGIGFSDFTTVKNFLIDIQKLKGNPVRAVQIIEGCGSLEKELSKLKIDKDYNVALHQLEQQTHEKQIKELQSKKEKLENELIEKEDERRTLQKKIIEHMEKITNLMQTRKALELQVDGLQKRLAEMLAVQPDIDAIRSAIPARKEELKDLEEKTNGARPILSVAVALESLLQKSSPDRKVLIRWLEFGGISKSFHASDELARKKITELLAKEGYVPKSEHDQTIKTMQGKIDKAEEDIRFWSNRAKKKSEKLIECEKLLREAHEAFDKQKNEELDKRIANFLASLLRQT